ncbi:MAG: pilus assembly PilX family protein [Gemmatimonadales bacterium]
MSTSPRSSGREHGFAMIVAIFALVIMSSLAITALVTADDERRSSRALRAGSASFYSAEAGLQEFWANDMDSAFVDSLNRNLVVIAPGATRDFGWRTMANGARYHVQLRRLDNGGQRIYQLIADGRGARGLAGDQHVRFLVTPQPGNGSLKLGKCCDAATTVRGMFRLDETGSVVTGTDTPPASWPAGRCAGIPAKNVIGVKMKDTTNLMRSSGTTLTGTPPKYQDAAMDSTAFLNYGSITFAQLKAMANHVIEDNIPAPATYLNLAATVNPDGTCKTSDPKNWGSSNPTHPCYNYFPIILVRGVQVEVSSGYGQALVLMDLLGGTSGLDFGLEGPVTFTGLILGQGCVDVEDGAKVYGAIYGDAVTGGQQCESSDGGLRVGKGGTGQVYWSNCVIQRLLEATGVAAASGGVPIAGVRRLARGFQTPLR